MDIKAVKFRKDGFYTQPFVFGGEEGVDKFDKNVRYRGSLQNYLIDTGSEVILVDTGIPAGTPEEVPDENSPIFTGKDVCSICGYVYDPAEHDGVAFEDLPDAGVVPVASSRRRSSIKRKLYELLFINQPPQGFATFAAVLFPRPFSRFSPKSHPNVAFPKCDKRNGHDTILQLFYPNLQKTSC